MKRPRSKQLLAEVRYLTEQLKTAKGTQKKLLLNQRCDKIIDYIISLRPGAQAALVALLLRRFDV